MRKSYLWCVLLGAVASSEAFAGIVLFSDDFQGEPYASIQHNYTGFANWHVTGGTVDLIFENDPLPYPVPTGYLDGHGAVVDLDGSSADAGTLISKEMFALLPGSYHLLFDIAGNHKDDAPPIDTLGVMLGNVFAESFTVATFDPFVTISRTILVGAGTTGNLSFACGGADNYGVILDNVRLVRADVVPEPSAFLTWASLLGLSLIGGWWRRRGRSVR